jgi:hypothetical protein
MEVWNSEDAFKESEVFSACYLGCNNFTLFIFYSVDSYKFAVVVFYRFYLRVVLIHV